MVEVVIEVERAKPSGHRSSVVASRATEKWWSRFLLHATGMSRLRWARPAKGTRHSCRVLPDAPPHPSSPPPTPRDHIRQSERRARAPAQARPRFRRECSQEPSSNNPCLNLNLEPQSLQVEGLRPSACSCTRTDSSSASARRLRTSPQCRARPSSRVP